MTNDRKEVAASPWTTIVKLARKFNLMRSTMSAPIEGRPEPLVTDGEEVTAFDTLAEAEEVEGVPLFPYWVKGQPWKGRHIF